jgi:hypothetical protein
MQDSHFQPIPTFLHFDIRNSPFELYRTLALTVAPWFIKRTFPLARRYETAATVSSCDSEQELTAKIRSPRDNDLAADLFVFMYCFLIKMLKHASLVFLSSTGISSSPRTRSALRLSISGL